MKINRNSTEWEAIREYTAARISEMTLDLRSPLSWEKTQELRACIRTLDELVAHFEPDQPEDEAVLDFGL